MLITFVSLIYLELIIKVKWGQELHFIFFTWIINNLSNINCKLQTPCLTHWYVMLHVSFLLWFISQLVSLYVCSYYAILITIARTSPHTHPTHTPPAIFRNTLFLHRPLFENKISIGSQKHGEGESKWKGSEFID